MIQNMVLLLALCVIVTATVTTVIGSFFLMTNRLHGWSGKSWIIVLGSEGGGGYGVGDTRIIFGGGGWTPVDQ